MRRNPIALASLLFASTALAQVPPEKAAPAPPPTVTPAPELSPPAAAEPLAGYNGSFFLRDPHDWFVLFPKGRLQIDGFFFPSRGDAPVAGNPAAPAPNVASDTRPKNTIIVRRARVDVQGTFFKHF